MAITKVSAFQTKCYVDRETIKLQVTHSKICSRFYIRLRLKNIYLIFDQIVGDLHAFPMRQKPWKYNSKSLMAMNLFLSPLSLSASESKLDWESWMDM